MERARKPDLGTAGRQHTAQAKFTSRSRESELEKGIDGSPAMVAQRQRLDRLFGPTIQRVEDEEPLQGKFDAVQRVEEEEPLQGKFEAIQRVEDEEPLQGKFAVTQAKHELGEEEFLPGRFGAAQRMEDEEPLQGKFETVQRVEEEEPLQGSFETAQRVEEEEPLQGKFEAVSSVQRKEEPAKLNNTGLPDNLKNGIESLSGISMDNVKVHYNSSQPAQLNAHAYAQGTDIHVAPGQEQHLPHEAWHVVQQAQGRVQPTMQMKDSVPVNDDQSLEHEADTMGAKALQLNENNALLPQTNSAKSNIELRTVTQCFASTVIGEEHGENKIEVDRKTSLFTRAGFGWNIKVEPSKLAAALVERNNWVKPNWKNLMITSMRADGDFKTVMNNAQDIANGQSPRWGAEDNLIGFGSHAEGGTKAPKNARTHIEDPGVRKTAVFLRTLAMASNAHQVTENQVNAGYPNETGFDVLVRIGLNENNLLRYANQAIRSSWTAQKQIDGFLGRTAVNPTSANVIVAGPQGLEQVTARQHWTRTTLRNINDGLGAILNAGLDSLITQLGEGMRSPIDRVNPASQQLITDIAVAKYHGGDRVLGRMHAVAALARTLTQIAGIKAQNDRMKTTPEAGDRNGYIVGDSHLTDLAQISAMHNGNDDLAATIGEINPIRRSEYANLRQDATDAVDDADRTSTLTVR